MQYVRMILAAMVCEAAVLCGAIAPVLAQTAVTPLPLTDADLDGDEVIGAAGDNMGKFMQEQMDFRNPRKRHPLETMSPPPFSWTTQINSPFMTNRPAIDTFPEIAWYPRDLGEEMYKKVQAKSFLNFLPITGNSATTTNLVIGVQPSQIAQQYAQSLMAREVRLNLLTSVSGIGNMLSAFMDRTLSVTIGGTHLDTVNNSMQMLNNRMATALNKLAHPELGMLHADREEKVRACMGSMSLGGMPGLPDLSSLITQIPMPPNPPMPPGMGGGGGGPGGGMPTPPGFGFSRQAGAANAKTSQMPGLPQPPMPPGMESLMGQSNVFAGYDTNIVISGQAIADCMMAGADSGMQKDAMELCTCAAWRTPQMNLQFAGAPAGEPISLWKRALFGTKNIFGQPVPPGMDPAVYQRQEKRLKNFSRQVVDVFGDYEADANTGSKQFRPPTYTMAALSGFIKDGKPIGGCQGSSPVAARTTVQTARADNARVGPGEDGEGRRGNGPPALGPQPVGMSGCPYTQFGVNKGVQIALQDLVYRWNVAPVQSLERDLVEAGPAFPIRADTINSLREICDLVGNPNGAPGDLQGARVTSAARGTEPAPWNPSSECLEAIEGLAKAQTYAAIERFTLELRAHVLGFLQNNPGISEEERADVLALMNRVQEQLQVAKAQAGTGRPVEEIISRVSRQTSRGKEGVTSGLVESINANRNRRNGAAGIGAFGGASVRT